MLKYLSDIAWNSEQLKEHSDSMIKGGFLDHRNLRRTIMPRGFRKLHHNITYSTVPWEVPDTSDWPRIGIWLISRLFFKFVCKLWILRGKTGTYQCTFKELSRIFFLNDFENPQKVVILLTLLIYLRQVLPKHKTMLTNVSWWSLLFLLAMLLPSTSWKCWGI
jgi:hypothetical protein